jgi:peptidoglycan/LPS O-acetylase OafA/YrhL
MRTVAWVFVAGLVALVVFGALNWMGAVAIAVAFVGYAITAGEDGGDDLP